MITNEHMEDRYKMMDFGEEINGEYIEYEDMTEDQLLDLFAEDHRRQFRYDEDYFESSYFEDDYGTEEENEDE